MAVSGNVTTKLQLVNWIYREIGGNTVNVELSDSAIEQHIDTAIQKFSEYSEDVIYSSAYVLTLSAGIDTYNLPSGTKCVSNFESDTASGGINTPFSSMNILYNQGAFDNLLWDTGGYSGLTTYELGMQYVEMSRNLLTVSFFLQYNKYGNTLTVTPIPAENHSGVLEIYTEYDPGTGSSPLYNEIWIKQYVLALSKISLGLIYGKYEGTPLPDGSTLNASMYLEEGKLDKEKLDEELIEKYASPLGFMVG